MQQNDPEVVEYLRRAAVAAEENLRITQSTIRFLKWIITAALSLLVITIGFDVYQAYREKERQSISDWYGADYYYKYRDFDATLRYIDRILEKTPRDYEALGRKAEVLLMKGDIDGARKNFQAAKDIFPIPRYQSAVEALTPPASQP